MEFDPVPHSHVVPVGYLRAWAQGRQIAMRRVGESVSALIGVRDAAVRTNFYRRTRPHTGEVIYDIEWSLREAESAGLPALRRMPETWPLTLEDKGKVGQLLALQYLRGPAFKAWHERHVAEQVATLRADPKRYARQDIEMSAEEAVERVAARLMSDTYRVTRMLKLARSVGIVFSSMHWTLVHFDASRLATSDHPMIVWPTRREPSVPRANDSQAGVLETLEAFAPIGPAHVLLMTWRFDEDTAVVPGARCELATANAYVIANAETQWFHIPGVDPWVAKGKCHPLSHALVRSYDAAEATRSPRRQQAVALANQELAAPLRNAPVSIVDVSRKPA
jgi:hypothetical protein